MSFPALYQTRRQPVRVHEAPWVAVKLGILAALLGLQIACLVLRMRSSSAWTPATIPSGLLSPGLDREYSHSLVLVAWSPRQAFSHARLVLPRGDTMRRGTRSHPVAGVFCFIPRCPFVVHGGHITDRSPAQPGGTKKERVRVRRQCHDPRDAERRLGPHLLYMVVACVSTRISRATDD
ncbi:hypothetical protein IFM62136_01161 [Aspergillus lentulus]|nr:hypothetical protein IFM62136_01161 [Aspergillus lentulus]